MALRESEFALDEWYHCYNRGVDKRDVFLDKNDYYRFLEQLYLANSASPLHRGNIRKSKFTDILQIPRQDPLVAIGAFCLMPNHYHLALKEIVEGGITKFMQKLGTGYTMYFNTRYDHSGNLFVKPFRSRHVHDDIYFQHLINYIHCNAAELFESEWKTGHVRDIDTLIERLLQYPYSSLKAYEDRNTSMYPILDECVFEIALKTPINKMIREAQEYYAENPELS